LLCGLVGGFALVGWLAVYGVLGSETAGAQGNGKAER
jgi:hypothetical protein